MSPPEKLTSLLIKVIPRSSKEGIVGWEGDELKIKLREVPEDGKANQALIALLSKTFHLPKQAITITRGETSRHKRVLILGITEEELLSLFPKDQELF